VPGRRVRGVRATDLEGGLAMKILVDVQAGS
jgi:hypothetical protein